MAKRKPGPKPTSTNTANLSTRIDPDLRKALEASATKRGKTLSWEVQHRLHHSLNKDDATDAEVFGSARNKVLMQLIALTMKSVSNPDKPDADWFDDPWSFHHVTTRIMRVINAVKPEGEIVPLSDPMMEAVAELQDYSAAAEVWGGIQNADDSQPTGSTRKERLANLAKVQFGDIANRPDIRVVSPTKRSGKGKRGKKS